MAYKRSKVKERDLMSADDIVTQLAADMNKSRMSAQRQRATKVTKAHDDQR
jgi:hypothetical protein